MKFKQNFLGLCSSAKINLISSFQPINNEVILNELYVIKQRNIFFENQLCTIHNVSNIISFEIAFQIQIISSLIMRHLKFNYKAYQCFFKENGKSLLCYCLTFCLL
jgi:hypothetical protein